MPLNLPSDRTLAASLLFASSLIPSLAQSQRAPAPPAAPDPVAPLVARLNLESYKATIKGLTQFGDRRQGTDRNRAAVDWIEAQLKSYGCTPTERIKYEYKAPPPRTPGAGSGTRPAPDPTVGPGGSRKRGVIMPDTVNNDPMKQPDLKLRELNMQPSADGEREEVFCTKIGAIHPDQMYILGGHMDGIGWGEAANDDGSGTALVMELARIFSSPGVTTDISIRFALWNNEETGTQRSPRLRRAAQGPPGHRIPRRLRQVSPNPDGSAWSSTT